MIIYSIKKLIKKLGKTPVDQNWLKQSQGQIISFMEQNPIKKSMPNRQFLPKSNLYHFLLRPVAVAAMVVALCLFAGTGVVVKAQNSLPTELLYPVKLATEKIQEAITLDNVKKVDLSVKLADKRLDEVKKLQEKQLATPAVVNETILKYQQFLTKAQEQLQDVNNELAPEKSINTSVKFENSLDKQHDKIIALSKVISSEIIPTLEKAEKNIIANSSKNIEKIESKILQNQEIKESKSISVTTSGAPENMAKIIIEKLPDYLPNLDLNVKKRIMVAEQKVIEIKNKIDKFREQKEIDCDPASQQAHLAKLEANLEKIQSILALAKDLLEQKEYLTAINRANEAMIKAIDLDNLVGQWQSGCSSLIQPLPKPAGLNQEYKIKVGASFDFKNVQIILNKIAACPKCPPGVKCISDCPGPSAVLTLNYFSEKRESRQVNLIVGQSIKLTDGVDLKLLKISEKVEVDYIVIMFSQESIASCSIPTCSGAYKTGQVDKNNCPIYECPEIKACQKRFSNCSCSYVCQVSAKDQEMTDCARFCSDEEINNYQPLCGYQDGVCKDLNKTVVCQKIVCEQGREPITNGFDKNGCAIWQCPESDSCPIPDYGCGGMYKSNEFTSAGCPIYKCPDDACPKYEYPDPQWCQGGKIIGGEIKSNGCSGPARCLMPDGTIKSAE